MIGALLHTLFTIVFIYAAVNIVYLFAAAVAGHLRKRFRLPIHPEKKKIAVLITSYKEDMVVVGTAKTASGHNYPSDHFSVFLAADQLQPDTLRALRQFPIKVHEVYFDTGSKARSLNYLLNSIAEENFDIAVVLDGDNVMQAGFLEKINAAFQNGFKAVQAHRTAKNTNTPVAVLDAVSEEINNHLFRKAQRSMGFSSSTIGSGMAFEFRQLKRVYNKPGILDNPACDREVDFEMMKAGIVVEYLEDAVVLDEKVSRQKVYQNQRRRWLESQVIHLKLFFSRKEHVVNKTKDYWNKLFINLIPPRIMFAALFVFIFIIYLIQFLFTVGIIHFPVAAWIVLFFFYCCSMLLSIPRKLYNTHLLRAFFYLPALLLSFLKAALTMQSGRKEFVHTPKSFTGDEN